MTLNFHRIRLFCGMIALAALLIGCGAGAREAEQATGDSAGEAAPVVVEPTAEPALVLLPTVTPNTAAPAPIEAAPTQAPAPVDWTTHAYLEGDYYILGNPDAAVRLIDYSDFL